MNCEERSLTTLLALLVISMFALEPVIREGEKLDILRGIFFSLVLLAGLREESELSNIPKLIQGTAMNLIIAGVLSMAFMGFAGLFSSS